jgi:hypothetical protein
LSCSQKQIQETQPGTVQELMPNMKERTEHGAIRSNGISGMAELQAGVENWSLFLGNGGCYWRVLLAAELRVDFFTAVLSSNVSEDLGTLRAAAEKQCKVRID